MLENCPQPKPAPHRDPISTQYPAGPFSAAPEPSRAREEQQLLPKPVSVPHATCGAAGRAGWFLQSIKTEQ